MTVNTVDKGTAYGRKPRSYLAKLTEVRAGTPAGEWLRRYWHVIGLSTDATERPRQIQVLGEDLILFRDKTGRPGLVYPHCSHRGSSLYFGRVEERGIRCCYHGWLFDVEGHCLEQPCEPEGGANRGLARQPWYPVREQYGVIWAYLGPPDKKPVLPRYEAFENLGTGEFLETDDLSIGSGGPVIVDCNWLQHWENMVDPFHVPILHGSFSGEQFNDKLAGMPEVKFSYSTYGVMVHSHRKLNDGKVLRRISGPAVPTLRVIPDPLVRESGPIDTLGFMLPMTDTSFRIYTIAKVREKGTLRGGLTRFAGGKRWSDLTPEEHQLYPGDYEAQVSQGPIAWHSEEHLATSDAGIGMLRRFLQQQIDLVAKGGDPVGVSFDVNVAPIAFEAGNFIEPA